MMYLNLLDNSQFKIITNGSNVLPDLQKIFKHLQHIDIPFCEWNNPFYYECNTQEDNVNKLIYFAQILGITIDKNKCISFDQQYFNKLHETFEKNYNGDSRWLDFHEMIHICESKSQSNKSVLTIHYRHLSGMLEPPFNKDMKDYTTQITRGDVYIEWAQLGKTPYTYWANKEPNNINRLCKLAVPWIKLKPLIKISLQDQNLLYNKKIDKFNAWWNLYKKDWCSHWNLQDWTIKDMYNVAVFGRIENVDSLILKLKSKIHPKRITLK